MTVRFRKWPKQSGKTGGAWYWSFTVSGVRSRERARNPENENQKARIRKEAEYFESIAYQRACNFEPIFKLKLPPWTFEKFVEERFRPLAEANHRRYANGAGYCLTALLPEFGKKLLAEITPFEIEAFKIRQKARKKKTGKNGETLKPKTVNLYLDCLSSIFTLAIGEKLRTDNPCDSVRHLEVEPITKRALTHEEEASLLAVCKGRCGPFNRDHVAHAIVILVEGGFRPEEFLTMKKSQVNLLTREATVASYKTGRRRSAQPKLRIVPISDRAAPHYQALMATEGEKLFPFSTLKKVWYAVRREAGLDGFWLRWLRDTAKHRWEVAGFGPFEIALMLGHSSPVMTMTYSQLNHQRALALMNKLAPRVEQIPTERTATAVQLYQL